MAGIYLWDDKILRVGGKIASHEDCCCEERECRFCSGDVPAQFSLTFANIGDGSCSECDETFVDASPIIADVYSFDEDNCYWIYHLPVQKCGVDYIQVRIYTTGGWVTLDVSFWSYVGSLKLLFQALLTSDPTIDCMAIDKIINAFTNWQYGDECLAFIIHTTCHAVAL